MLNHTILIKVFLSFVIFFRFKIIPRQSDNPKPLNIKLRFETCESENLTLSTFKFGFPKYVSGNNTATNNKIKVNSISMWSVSIMGGCTLYNIHFNGTCDNINHLHVKTFSVRRWVFLHQKPIEIDIKKCTYVYFLKRNTLVKAAA